jgi:hypothetical protein
VAAVRETHPAAPRVLALRAKFAQTYAIRANLDGTDWDGMDSRELSAVMDSRISPCAQTDVRTGVNSAAAVTLFAKANGRPLIVRLVWSALLAVSLSLALVAGSASGAKATPLGPLVTVPLVPTLAIEPVASPSIDLTPPALTLSTPVEGSFTSGSSELVSGHAGVAAGDLPAITVDLYTGASIAAGQIPLESIVVQATGEEWSVTVAGLALGTYTVRAEQSDLAGNLAVSAAATFQVLAPAGAPTSPATAGLAPTASFTWLPLTPRVEEPVALLSTSAAGGSPLTEFEWATTATGPFELEGQAHSMTFTSPGEHLIRLQVTAADGLSSTISKEVSVLPRAHGLMDPFPIVQLAGAYSSRGVDLKLLRVQVPLGTHVIVRCAGRACPVAWEKYEAAPGHGSLVPVEFHSFERAMPAGVTISVRVFQAEEIGKLTRFVVRAGRPPVRTDTCLGAKGEKPVRCPA